MTKYSYEFKKKVVQAYLNGEGGCTHLAEKYDVKNKRQVLNWVHSYSEGDRSVSYAETNPDNDFLSNYYKSLEIIEKKCYNNANRVAKA